MQEKLENIIIVVETFDLRFERGIWNSNFGWSKMNLSFIKSFLKTIKWTCVNFLKELDKQFNDYIEVFWWLQIF